MTRQEEWPNYIESAIKGWLGWREIILHFKRIDMRMDSSKLNLAGHFTLISDWGRFNQFLVIKWRKIVQSKS